jgi:hypothetical protein
MMPELKSVFVIMFCSEGREGITSNAYTSQELAEQKMALMDVSKARNPMFSGIDYWIKELTVQGDNHV